MATVGEVLPDLDRALKFFQLPMNAPAKARLIELQGYLRGFPPNTPLSVATQAKVTAALAQAQGTGGQVRGRAMEQRYGLHDTGLRPAAVDRADTYGRTARGGPGYQETGAQAQRLRERQAQDAVVLRRNFSAGR